MSLEHSPTRSDPTATAGIAGSARGPPVASDYWDAFIDEKAAAAFLDLTPRTMQGWRQKGDGPRYVAFSSRCLRYTRRWLREHAEARVRTSTSDPGPRA
jgi:hypothetical protein